MGRLQGGGEGHPWWVKSSTHWRIWYAVRETCYTDVYLMHLLDLIWTGSSSNGICYRDALSPRPLSPHILRSLWSYPVGSIQRDRGIFAQRWVWKIEVLWGNTDSYNNGDCCGHGILAFPGLDFGWPTVGYSSSWYSIRIPPSSHHVCSERLFDGEQNGTYPKAMKRSEGVRVCQLLDISAQGFTLIDYLNVRTIVEWKDKSTSGFPMMFHIITSWLLSCGHIWDWYIASTPYHYHWVRWILDCAALRNPNSKSGWFSVGLPHRQTLHRFQAMNGSVTFQCIPIISSNCDVVSQLRFPVMWSFSQARLRANLLI